MRKCLTIVFLFAFIGSVQAQSSGLGPFHTLTRSQLNNADHLVDSLRPLLVQGKDDTAKINILLLLAQAYERQTKMDSAFQCYQQVLHLSQKRPYIRGLFDARRGMTALFRRIGNFPKALQLSLMNVPVAEQYKDTLRLWFTLGDLCGLSDEMNDFHKQIAYARKQYELALSGYFQRQKDTRNVDFPYFINMALAFTGLNQKDSALYYYQRYHEQALSQKNNANLTIVNGNLGDALFKFGDYDQARSHYSQTIHYGTLSQFPYWIANSYLGWAKIYDQNNQFDSALHYAKLSLHSFQRMKMPARELNAASFLDELYTKEKQMDSAHYYLALTMALKDSLFDLEKVKQMQNLQFDETLRLQQLEQGRKEAQQQYKTNIKVFSLIAGLAILMLLAFFLYRNNRIKQKANVQLQEQKQKVEQAYTELKATQAQLIQREKMASLGELTAGIAHEIQNPLNFVNNFSEVNTELIQELKQENSAGKPQEVQAIAGEIEQNLQKINHHGKRADAIVKGMLQHSRVSTGKKEPTNINALADEYLRLAYQAARTKDKSFQCELKTQFDPSIDQIDVVPQDIGRVLLNLFNNALYAVCVKQYLLNSPYKPEVAVSTKKEDGKVMISVRDNGNGIPQKVLDKIFQPFFTTKPTGEGTGLGLSLSYDIVTKRHGGELKVNTKEGEYAEFIILLPTSA